MSCSLSLNWTKNCCNRAILFKLAEDAMACFLRQSVHYNVASMHIRCFSMTMRYINRHYLSIYLCLVLAVWLSGNTLPSINVVALHQTRLVLGWVTVCGWVNHLGMLPAS